jgi:hypothetical protein
MPRPDCLTIHTHDLQQIIDALESNQVGATTIKIIDDGRQIIIRDPSDFRIASITKSETPSNKTKSNPHETRFK